MQSARGIKVVCEAKSQPGPNDHKPSKLQDFHTESASGDDSEGFWPQGHETVHPTDLGKGQEKRQIEISQRHPGEEDPTNNRIFSIHRVFVRTTFSFSFLMRSI